MTTPRTRRALTALLAALYVPGQTGLVVAYYSPISPVVKEISHILPILVKDFRRKHK